jgi:ribosomal protein L11 methyltransferase
MKFIQVEIKGDSNFTEILIAELSEHEYDSFWEEEDGLLAYIEKEKFNEQVLKDLKEKYWEANISYSFSGMESKNWNEEWEKNFQPIIVADKCYVRAPFHEPNPDLPIEIIIEPKMSFGTGHHATTSMMIEHLLGIDLTGKAIMDIGCGSGILSIAAIKFGAASVFAFDIDEWSVENTAENLLLNQTVNVEVAKGTIADYNDPDKQFDLILANITRNILLQEMSSYIIHLKKGGLFAISGFYEADIPVLEAEAKKNGLQKASQLIREGDWASVVFKA